MPPQDVVLWPITLDSIEQGRIDSPLWEGDARGVNKGREAPYRDASRRTSGDVAIPDRNRRFTIRVGGIALDGKRGYVEVDFPRTIKVQLPVVCSETTHVLAALRLCESVKNLPSGYFSKSFGPGKRACVFQESLAVGYVPDDDMKPKTWPILHLKVNTAGMFRSVSSFFRYTDIPCPHGKYRAEVHVTLDHVDEFSFATGCTTAMWCVFKGLVPFRAKGVSLYALEGIAHSAEPHPSPPPDPDAEIHMYDIECVGNSREDWLRARDIPSERDKLPDPNKLTHEVRMISSLLYGLKSHRSEALIFEFGSPFSRPTDIKMRGCSYRVLPFSTELDMIMAFFDYARANADARFGYNNHLFDLPYLIVRVQVLTAGKVSICRHLVMGAIPGERYASFYSFDLGRDVSVVEECQKRKAVSPHGVGTLFIDMIDLLKSGKFGDYKSYKLKDTSAEVIGKASKDPLTYIDIADCLHVTMSKERYAELCKETGIDVGDPTHENLYALVRHYCFLDSDVLRRMFEIRSMWDTLCSTCTMSMVPLQTVCDKKSKILVTTEHAKLCYQRGVVLNTRYRDNPMPTTEDGKAFEGGVVLEATKGLHACCPDDEPKSLTKSLPEQYLDAVMELMALLPDELAIIVFIMCDYFEPLVTLDLMSMYPSIMRRWNLSPDTILVPDARPYACEQFDKAIMTRRRMKWFDVKDIIPNIPDSVLHSLKDKPGYWPDAPMNDKYNAFVIPSPVSGCLPRVIYVVKVEHHDGVYNAMVGRAFDGRRDRKNLMKALGKVAKAAQKIAGGSKNVEDHRDLVREVDRMRRAGEEIKVEELPELVHLTMEEVAGAASKGHVQADSEQAVLKIINNAMYGANGFKPPPRSGSKPKPPRPTECLEVAAIVTAVGRQMNKEMEDRFCDHTIDDAMDIKTKQVKKIYKKWGVWRAIGDTDSVIVKYAVAGKASKPDIDGEPSFEGMTPMQEAFAKAEFMAKDCTVDVWGDDKKRVLEVDGVTPYAYVSGKKNRCELLYEYSGAKPKRKVSGMCPKKKNEPWIKREPIQGFVDLVMDCGPMRITGFRLLLIHKLHGYFEKLLLPPEEGGYSVEDYSTSTHVGQLSNLAVPHLVALTKRCKRQGVPLSFYSGQYMPWVTVYGSGKPTLRTEDTTFVKWKDIDRCYAFTNTVAGIIKKTVVDKPWVHDGTPILPVRVWALMYDTYKNILSRQTSGIINAFTSNRMESTRDDRLKMFVQRFVEDRGTHPSSRPKASASKRKTKDISSFFSKKKKP